MDTKKITRRIYLLTVGKYSKLTEEEKAILKKIDLKITINLITPSEKDIETVDKIFAKYF